MDVIEMLRWFRIFKFVAIISLRKNQAQLVKYFQAYSLQAAEDSKIEDTVGKSNLELDDLMRGFEPGSDRTDRVMLYLLTGRNMDNVMEEWLDDEQDHNAADEDGQGKTTRKGPGTSI